MLSECFYASRFRYLQSLTVKRSEHDEHTTLAQQHGAMQEKWPVSIFVLLSTIFTTKLVGVADFLAQTGWQGCTWSMQNGKWLCPSSNITGHATKIFVLRSIPKSGTSAWCTCKTMSIACGILCILALRLHCYIRFKFTHQSGSRSESKLPPKLFLPI